jgi:anaerobic magnesium-protoporphyrin IX monomethyl ester cyclase
MNVLFVWPSLDCPPGINHGLASLSAVLKARGHATSLIHVSEALWPVPTLEELHADIARRAPDLLAFSATTQQFGWIKEAAAFLRPRLAVPFVIGGVHCTMGPEEIAATGLFDFVCVGEGEHALGELVDRLARGASCDDCPNMYVRKKDGTIVRNPVGPFPDPAALPPEDYELFDLRRIVGGKDGWMSIITSRGCPFACTYCFNAEIVERYRKDGAITSAREYLRHQPVARVIDDIRRLSARYPEITTIIFDDDLFTLEKKYVLEFCATYRAAGLALPFVINAHCLVFSEDMARALAGAGCRIVKFGLESGNERVRTEILNRRMSNAAMIKAVRIANEAGLHSSAFIMFGLPTETREEALDTLRLCADANVGRFRWALFYPYPGTAAHAVAAREGLLDDALLASSGNYFEGTCLKFPPDHALFLDKLARIAPWYANAMSSFPCRDLYAARVAEIEALSAEEWRARKDAVRREDRALSDDLLAKRVPHYSIRFASVMGVHSEYVRKEMAEQAAAKKGA